MKKHLVIIINILFILTAIISPFIINELYKTNKGYLVLWEAKDMLIICFINYFSVSHNFHKLYYRTTK